MASYCSCLICVWLGLDSVCDTEPGRSCNYQAFDSNSASYEVDMNAYRFCDGYEVNLPGRTVCD
jgi:hypothetical protein